MEQTIQDTHEKTRFTTRKPGKHKPRKFYSRTARTRFRHANVGKNAGTPYKAPAARSKQSTLNAQENSPGPRHGARQTGIEDAGLLPAAQMPVRLSAKPCFLIPPGKDSRMTEI